MTGCFLYHGKDVVKIRSTGRSLIYKLKRVERVYSFHGYVDLKYFFSIFDPDKRSLVIVSDVVAKCPFLSDVVGEDQIISLIDPPYFGHPHPPLITWPRHFLPFLDAAIKLRWLFRFTNGKAEAFMLNDFNVFTIFVLTEVFRRKNIKVKHIDTCAWLRTERSSDVLIRSRGPQFKKHLNILSRIAGTEITEGIYRPIAAGPDDPGHPASATAVGYVLADSMEKIEIAVTPWDKLIERFNLGRYAPGENAVLVIDTLFAEAWPKVDRTRTYERTANYFASKLRNDQRIHFKPHYLSPGSNVFQSTVIEGKVDVLEASVPAEVYMEFYDEIYFFSSLSAAFKCKGKKYSLAPLIAFLSEDEKERFLTIQKLKFGDEIDNIELVSDSGS